MNDDKQWLVSPDTIWYHDPRRAYCALCFVAGTLFAAFVAVGLAHPLWLCWAAFLYMLSLGMTGK